MLVSILTSWFGARSWIVFARVLLYTVVVGVVFYLRWDAYNDGVADTVEKYETLIQEERLRIQEANQAALNRANVRIAELQRLLRARNAELLELQRRAEQDPDADRPAIGADSVQRLNQIR